MTLPLTTRQEQLWRYIKSCERSPSFAEMKQALGLDSKSGVHRLIAALEERGYIRRIPNRARSVVALDPPPHGEAFAYQPCQTYPLEVIYIPLRGRIS